MPIRTMLVHVDDTAQGALRAKAAARVARETGARLIGVYLAPGGEIAPSVASMLPPGIVDALSRAAGEAQEAAATSFRDAAAAEGIARVAWRAPAGDPVMAVLAHGRACDLVVLGQRDPDAARSRFTGELFTAALVGLGRPILAMPRAGSPETIGRRILVATDGGREAARAIGDAMPFLERAAQVNVLVGGRGAADDATPFARTGVHVADWLRDHGVTAALERYEWDEGGKGEWLLSRAADYGSDLIVMGGYGHSRLREIVLGGMTDTILREMTVPVLLSH